MRLGGEKGWCGGERWEAKEGCLDSDGLSGYLQVLLWLKRDAVPMIPRVRACVQPRSRTASGGDDVIDVVLGVRIMHDLC